MSLIRTAAYRPHAARICRAEGHRWEGDRCAVCAILRDPLDAAPWQAPSAHRSGVGMGAFARIVTTERRPGRPRPARCAEGHEDWRETAKGRVCRRCVAEWQRRRRAS